MLRKGFQFLPKAVRATILDFFRENGVRGFRELERLIQERHDFHCPKSNLQRIGLELRAAIEADEAEEREQQRKARAIASVADAMRGRKEAVEVLQAMAIELMKESKH